MKIPYQNWVFRVCVRKYTASQKLDLFLFLNITLSNTVRFLPRDAMHKRGLCRHAVSVCLSVCPSVTFVSCVKTNKDIFEIFSPSGSQAILVFPRQTGWRYSDGNPPNGGVECRWGRQKRDSERISLHTLHTGLQCYKPYESRSVKNKASNVGKRRAEHSRRRPSPFFAQDEDELFVTGSTLYARDGGQTPLRTQPPWS